MEAHPNAEPFLLIPIGADGLMILLKTSDIEEKNFRKWGFGFYDTNMDMQWEFLHPVPRNHEYGAYSHSHGELSILFYDSKTSADTNVYILNISTKKKQLSVFEGKTDKRFNPFCFIRQAKYCYLGSNAKNTCKIYRIDIETGEILDLKLNESGGIFLENICADSVTSEILALTSMRNDRRRNALYLHRFDVVGHEKTFMPLIRGENRKMATSAEYVRLDNDSFMVLGSFTANPHHRTSLASDTEGTKSSGFYRIIADSELSEPLVQFYNFAELANFETYLRGKSSDKKRRSLGGLLGSAGTSGLEHNLVIHNIEKYHDIYMILAEAYTPDYRTITTVVYDFYGRPVPRSYSVFDGYRYSHAMVVAFDQQGRLLWDNGMEMINIRTFDQAEKVAIYMDEGGLALAFNHDGKIAWKQVKENQVVTQSSYANIETKYSKDRITLEQNSRFTHWYDNFFLASGYQTIVNNYLPLKNQRNVFYVNKIAFD